MLALFEEKIAAKSVPCARARERGQGSATGRARGVSAARHGAGLAAGRGRAVVASPRKSYARGLPSMSLHVAYLAGR